MDIVKFSYLAGIDFGIQWVLWGLASCLKYNKFYDSAGSLALILVAFLCYQKYSHGHPQAKIQTAAIILIWAVRFGFYVFSRLLLHDDRQFKDGKEDPLVFFVYWTLQGVWVVFTLLPSLMMVMQKNKELLIELHLFKQQVEELKEKCASHSLSQSKVFLVATKMHSADSPKPARTSKLSPLRKATLTATTPEHTTPATRMITRSASKLILSATSTVNKTTGITATIEASSPVFIRGKGKSSATPTTTATPKVGQPAVAG